MGGFSNIKVITQLLIQDSSFTNGIANLAGVLYGEGQTIKIIRTTFKGNSALNVTIFFQFMFFRVEFFIYSIVIVLQLMNVTSN
jgi:hypothetical protein